MQKKGSEPDFSRPWHRSDVVLVRVEGKIFHVHKGMLSMCSPVFEKMFSADFRKKTSTEIPLPGKKASEIQEMLLVIYPTAKPVTEQNYAFLLELAREYQMEQLIGRCEKYLLGREKSLSQAVDFLVLADEFQLKELSEQCVEIAKTMPLNQLKCHEKYAQIEHVRGRQVVERRVELLEQEVETMKNQVRTAVDWAVMQLGDSVLTRQNWSLSNLSRIKAEAKEKKHGKLFWSSLKSNFRQFINLCESGEASRRLLKSLYIIHYFNAVI